MTDAEIQEALDAARHMIEHGVPVFIAEPHTDASGTWQPTDGHNGTGYFLPRRWQHTEPDPDVVDRWQPGQALCALTGCGLDLLDLDPHKGGELGDVARPRSYGRASTPSGGTHDWIAGLGQRSRDGVLPGVDVKSGDPDGAGRGFAFLPPTVKRSKVDGQIHPYRWIDLPDLDVLDLLGVDDSGDELASLLHRSGSDARLIASWDGEAYEDLDPGHQRWAQQHAESMIDWWRTHLDGVEDWPEGETDSRGRGWEALSRDLAWALALLAVCPWTPTDEAEAERLYYDLLPEALAQDPRCQGKWSPGLLDKASDEPVDSPPWHTGFTPIAVARPANRPTVIIDSTAEANEWLRDEVGKQGTPLAGMFLRGNRLVHTPKIGEEGYRPMTSGVRDFDGPAQIRDLETAGLKSRVQTRYNLVKVGRGGNTSRVMFPVDAAASITAAPDETPNLRPLRLVTHTPIMRPDGTVLAHPGYDSSLGAVFLPDGGIRVPEVPEVPSDEDVAKARELLLRMLADFPFNTVHDRANYLALLLTPLIREMVGPPYQLVAINAHQRGSGKSLLAWIARTLHGGVIRGDVPGTTEEYRKQITSILAGTTGPVVQFDNVTKLRATQLDALLTSAVWTDRMLGETREISVPNDRVWCATGNNIQLGGDLPRRVLWVTIDPRQPDPENRTGFAIDNLEGWVNEHRSELIAALLTLVRFWVVQGRPLVPARRSDSYADWLQLCESVLSVCGVPGQVGHSETVQSTETGEEEEWSELLERLEDMFGTRPWTAAEAVRGLDPDSLPADMKPGARSLGKWLAVREGRWAGGRCARMDYKKGNLKHWRIESRETN